MSLNDGLDAESESEAVGVKRPLGASSSLPRNFPDSKQSATASSVGKDRDRDRGKDAELLAKPALSHPASVTLGGGQRGSLSGSSSAAVGTRLGADIKASTAAASRPAAASSKPPTAKGGAASEMLIEDVDFDQGADDGVGLPASAQPSAARAAAGSTGAWSLLQSCQLCSFPSLFVVVQSAKLPLRSLRVLPAGRLCGYLLLCSML